MDWGNLEVVFNRWESVLWFAFALICACASLPRTAKSPRNLRILAIAFAAFGVSDIVESQTGAWWRPWWLLVLKTACVLVIARYGWRLWKERPSKR
jgi:hypothetical protein